MDAAPREFPEKPRVDRSASQVTAFRSLSRPRYLIQDPLKLGSREIGIQHESRLPLNPIASAFCSHSIAGSRRSTILPNDRVVDRIAGAAIPNHGRFSLIGDPNGMNCISTGYGAHRFLCYFALRSPNLFGIVLDPALLWVILRKFLLSNFVNLPVAIEQDCAGTRSALVQCHEEGHRMLLQVERHQSTFLATNYPIMG